MKNVRWEKMCGMIFVVCVFCGLSWSEVVDRILATVDTEVILLSDVMVELAPSLNELRRTSGSEQEFVSKVDELIRSTVQQAVDNRLLYREALLAGLQVRDDVVEQRLAELRKLYPSEEEFQRDLQESGETLSDLRSRLKKQLLAYKMSVDKRELFARSVTVSEEDVLQYYQEHQSEFLRPEQVLVRQIFLRAPREGNERGRVRARLEQLREEILSGGDFVEMAKEYSEAPGASEGGIIGWVKRGDLQDALEKVVFTLAPGVVSEVVETEGGYHILRVDERREAGLVPLDEARKEIEPILRAQEAKKLYDRWLADLRKRSRVRMFLD